MPSSISRFSTQWPGRAAWLAGLAVLTWVAAAAYTVRLNPEIRFYRHAIRVKRAWSQALDQAHAHKVVVGGGSSAAFAVDGERLWRQHQLPVVNAGLHVGMEAPFLTAFAMKLTRPGDTLVLAMEPYLITRPFTAPDLAAQMGLALGEPDLIHAAVLDGPGRHWVDDLMSLRPGAYHTFTLVGKILLGRPLYRYGAGDVRPSGWVQTGARREFATGVPPSLGLSDDAHRLLIRLKNWGVTNRVEVVFFLPWLYVSSADEPIVRRGNARLLLEVVALLPVLRDPALGVYPVRDHYADTQLHLTGPGAAAHSDALAAQLQEGRYWSRAELEALANPR